jgi:uncharacterized protein
VRRWGTRRVSGIPALLRLVRSCATLPGMDRGRVLETLREHESELRAAGVVHLRVFGSVARGEATAASDVDLLADFDPSQPVTLVTLGSLESHLSRLLGAKVDLSSAAWLKPTVSEWALREAVVGF